MGQDLSLSDQVRGRAQDLLYGAAAYFYAQETMNSAAKDASQATFQHNVNAYQGLGRDAFYAHLHQQYVALGYPPAWAVVFTLSIIAQIEAYLDAVRHGPPKHEQVPPWPPGKDPYSFDIASLIFNFFGARTDGEIQATAPADLTVEGQPVEMGRNFNLSSPAIASLPAGITVAINEAGNRVVTMGPSMTGTLGVVGRSDARGGPENDFGGRSSNPDTDQSG